MGQHEPSPTGTTSPSSNAKHLHPVQREGGLEQHLRTSAGCMAPAKTWQKCSGDRFRKVSVFPRYGRGMALRASWRENSSMSRHSLASLTLPGFEGNMLKTSQSGHLSRPKERPSMLALHRQPLLRYAVLRCSGTGAQVTSAHLCGSSVLQILRDWHCETLKCHLFFMESQQTLKAWTLATNRDGFFFFCIWGG